MITKFNLVMERSDVYYDNSLFSEQVTSPTDIYRLATLVGMHRHTEEVLSCFAMNTQHEIIAYFEISRGSLTASIVSPAEIFKRLLLANARNFILMHNHPSGDPTPSPADIDVTKVLSKISNMFEITLIDHVIIGNENFSSLRELNLMRGE